MALLFDTDIIIEYLRGSSEAINFIEQGKDDYLISTISVAELFTGVRNDKDKDAINTFLLGFKIIPISESIARHAGLIRQKYLPSHGTSLADALIAATAINKNAGLVSFNAKHFQMIENLIIPYKRQK